MTTSHLSEECLRAMDIFQAARDGDARSLELFLGRDDPNIQDDDGNTALMLASWRGYRDLVEILLGTDADPNIQNDDGNTALMWASFHGYTRILSMLLEAGADPTMRNDEGQTALRLTEDQEILVILTEVSFRFGVSAENVASDSMATLGRLLATGNADFDLFVNGLGNWRVSPPLYLEYL